MRFAAAFFVLWATLALHGIGFAQTRIDIAVRWAGTIPPARMVIDDLHQSLDMKPRGKDQYWTQYTLRTNGILRAEIKAQYSDSYSANIYIKLRPKYGSISATVFHVGKPICNVKTVEPLKQMAGSVDKALEAYFIARTLYYSGGCGSLMREEVAKAWFDRSYELTKLAPYFDLSGEASAAYSAYNRRAVLELKRISEVSDSSIYVKIDLAEFSSTQNGSQQIARVSLEPGLALSAERAARSEGQLERFSEIDRLPTYVASERLPSARYGLALLRTDAQSSPSLGLVAIKDVYDREAPIFTAYERAAERSDTRANSNVSNQRAGFAVTTRISF